MSTPRRPVLPFLALGFAVPIILLCAWYIFAMVVGLDDVGGQPLPADALWAPATGLMLSGLLIYLGLALRSPGRISRWNHLAAVISYVLGALYAAVGVMLLSLGTAVFHIVLGLVLGGAAVVLIVVAVAVQLRIRRQRRGTVTR